jgi:hypothetical protein
MTGGIQSHDSLIEIDPNPPRQPGRPHQLNQRNPQWRPIRPHRTACDRERRLGSKCSFSQTSTTGGNAQFLQLLVGQEELHQVRSRTGLTRAPASRRPPPTRQTRHNYRPLLPCPTNVPFAQY